MARGLHISLVGWTAAAARHCEHVVWFSLVVHICSRNVFFIIVIAVDPIAGQFSCDSFR